MSMFYTLENSINTSEIGSEYPQIQNTIKEHDPRGHNCAYAVAKLSGQFIGFIPHLDGFLLSKKSKITDVLSVVFLNAQGYLVSEKLKDFLEH